MSTRPIMDAHAYRVALLRVIWSGARKIGDSFDPREFAPKRLSGQPGETFSQCTLDELVTVAYAVKKAGAYIWVPAPPRGLNLRSATPYQLERITALLHEQTYLRDPRAFFIERLKVKYPEAPTYAEAVRMLGYLTTKQRSLPCAQSA